MVDPTILREAASFAQSFFFCFVLSPIQVSAREVAFFPPGPLQQRPLELLSSRPAGSHSPPYFFLGDSTPSLEFFPAL